MQDPLNYIFCNLYGFDIKKIAEKILFLSFMLIFIPIANVTIVHYLAIILLIFF